MADLKPLLRKAAGEYQVRKSAAEGAAVRWEHWSGAAYDPKPFYFERALYAGVVRRGKKVAKPGARTCTYGFDSRGHLVVDRQPKSADEPAFDEFFTHSKDGIESAAYRRDPPHELTYVTRQIHRNGVPTRTDVLDHGAAADYSESYAYTKARLTDIEVTSIAGAEKDVVSYDIVYERDGTLRTIRRHYDYLKVPFPIYWNPRPGETLESLTAAMRKKLLDLIPKTIRKARIKQPAYCIAIVYDTENDELPPLLAVGLEVERQAFLIGHGKSARDYIWNPAEFSRYETGIIDLDAPNLAEDSQKLLQFILMKQALWIPSRLLNETALELNKRSWKGILPTTDDFLVYAIDLEGVDFAKNLKGGVPEKKRKLLRSRRML